MSEKYVDIVVASFNDEAVADTALSHLKRARSEKQIYLHDAVIVWRDVDNKVYFKDPKDAGAIKGALEGGIAGAAVGVILGPLVLPAALVGAAFGAIVQKLHDGGVPDDKLKMLAESLKAGTAAIVAVTDPDSSAAIEKILKDAGAVVVTEGLNEYTSQQLMSTGRPDQVSE